MKWISVKDHRTNDFHTKLVYIPNDFPNIVRATQGAYGIWVKDTSGEEIHPTHWMPPPGPPRMIQNE